MSDPRVEKLAKILVDYSVAVRPRDRVLIRGEVLAAPLAAGCEREVIVIDDGWPAAPTSTWTAVTRSRTPAMATNGST